MRPWGVASVLAVAGALALPAPALAIDHVSLFVSPSKLAAGDGWRLSASVPAPESTRGEIVGVTLARSFLNGRAEERHALRASLRGVTSVSFDGRRGRWNLRSYVGPVLSVNMRIQAMGAAQPRNDPFGCRGAFVGVPVSLRGTFALRTSTAFFGTIRRVRLRGVVIFNRGGPVECTLPTTVSCRPSAQLTASSADATQTVVAARDAGGWLSVQFREAVASTPVANTAWYHVMSVSQVESLSGQLPTLELRVPQTLPISGAGAFTATTTAESSAGPCQTTTARGTFAGTFQTRFAGWGARAATLSGGQGTYREDR
jgi:hypothetical protein